MGQLEKSWAQLDFIEGPGPVFLGQKTASLGPGPGFWAEKRFSLGLGPDGNPYFRLKIGLFFEYTRNFAEKLGVGGATLKSLYCGVLCNSK